MKLKSLLVLSWLILGCTEPSYIDRDFLVLFSVDGVERTVYDFESSYVAHLISTGKNDSNNEREVHLAKMIDDILLANSAINKGLKNHPIYQAAVDYQKRKSMIDNYFVDEMDEKLEPLTDDEIRLAYAKKQRTVYVRHLYSKNKDEIQQAYDSLESDINFVDLANKFYKTLDYDSSAGYLGPVNYFGVDDVFAEAAYSTNEGEYSKPIRTRLGYHIIFVDHITFPAILAEDEYQYRKQGIESQLRLRKQQLTSNDYIYELMSELDVQTNTQNLIELREIISNLDNNSIVQETVNPENSEVIWTDNRIKKLTNSFDGNAVLTTYELDGQLQVFSFGEYLNWLPYLSFQESKLRLGASVGRGLRNQVLYELAQKRNYDEDDRVKQKVEKRAVEILSELNQYQMSIQAIKDTTFLIVPESFRDRLISSKNLLLQAEYWKIPVSSMEEAMSVKNKIEQGISPIVYPGYQRVDFSSIDNSESDYDLVRKSLIETPIIASSSQTGWMVIQVNKREITEIDTETNVNNLQRSFKVFSKIQTELDSLRSQANIDINTELFEEMYKIWSPSNM
ncbi:MAG: putative parvulin-type peptidyl-prolyl cis-trans isomerase [Rhodothermaeota bacterium MED-G12]|nr:MAG: putative parvulin-type peptidyl-prolyl cis-trans isomerase [Rhodothermaeota bacterium MED-G12]